MQVCPRCGEENPERARFCMACTAPLAVEAPAPREVRKTVTVLFCDVTGFTGLGERVDPESLRRAMTRYFDAMKAVLELHGGTVEKFIGDAVMAVFGLPILHEDDALRAARAAVAMQARLTGLNVELERDFEITLSVRIGVTTGPVVAGDPAAGHVLVTGDAVNVAARLQQAAQPGGILIGRDTYRLVRDAVTVEPVEPLALKGKTEPVVSFRLVEVLPEVGGYLPRMDSPMVGRDRQQSMLQQAFDAVVAEGTCRLFTVLGPAGVGKSRLIEEFLNSVGERATVLRGRCLAYGEGITFWPVAGIVKGAALIGEDDSPEEARSKIASLLEGEEDQSLVAEHVAQAIGLADGAATSGDIAWAVRRLLDTLARARPLIVVFDDTHWGEPTFLDLVEHVADWTKEAPILLICLARQELLDHRPAWGGGKVNATSVLLEPLTEEESGRLVDNLLGATTLAEEARARITGSAEGNPLFVEEMMSMLVDDGLLRREDGRWIPTADLSSVPIPPTIQALVAARLDRLSREERQVVECASLVGKLFWQEAVQELCTADLRPSVQAQLMALVRKELIRPERAELPGKAAFRFRHILIRDAAYESMPKEVRAELHQQFVDWLEKVASDRPAENEEIRAYHLEQAHRYRSELGPIDERGQALASRAAGLLASAGRRAYARADGPAAANLLSRAVALLKRDDRIRLQLLLDLAAAFGDVGKLEEAEALYIEAMQAAEASDDEQVRWHARVALWDLRMSTVPQQINLAEMRREAEQAIQVFDRLGYDLGHALAWFLVFKAEPTHVGGKKAAERALEHARRAGRPRQEADALGLLATTLVFGPTPVPEAVDFAERALRQAGGNRLLRAWMLGFLSRLRAMQGRLPDALDLIGEAAGILREFGLSFGVAWAMRVRGELEMSIGNVAAAEGHFRASHGIYQEIGDRDGIATAAARIAQALCAQRRYDEALSLTKVSEEQAFEDPTIRTWWRRIRALALAGMGRMDEAVGLAREAVAIAQPLEEPITLGDALMDLAEVLRQAGQRDEAARVAREALRVFEGKGDVFSSTKARAMLTDLAASVSNSD